MKTRTKNTADYIIVFITLVLTFFGILMIFSAGSPYAKSSFNDIYHFVKDQMFAAVIGLVAMILLSYVPYTWYKKLAWPIIGVTAILLVLTYVPQIGISYSDARRWINILGIEFQPSEIYKIAYIMFISKLVIDFKKKDKPLQGYLVIASFIVLSASVIFFQPHFSAAIIISLTGFVLLFAGGTKIKYLLFTFVPVVALGIWGAFSFEYMRVRIRSWIDPFNYPTDSGYQIIQSLYAISSGGLFGKGLGKSTQKFLYIPEPQNDFIFSILAEELGYLGVLAVVALFCVLLWRGVRVAVLCNDLYGTLLATGITFLIFTQTILNIGVVTGLLPNTGITLPFFSYGGTSLVVFLASAGILINISKNRTDNDKTKKNLSKISKSNKTERTL